MSDDRGRMPNFLIVGAAKCGTTSLYNYLRQHPDVFMPERKEPNFFAGPSHGNRVTEREYRALFAGVRAERAVGEASVSYLYDDGVAGRILNVLGPGTRILILLRNPVDMAYSLWGHMVRAGGEKLPFLEAVRAEPQRMMDEDFVRNRIGWIYNYAYLDRGRYAVQVQRYLSVFGANVKVLVFEEFFRDVAASFADVCRFLGVDETFRPDFRVHKMTGPPVSMALQDAIQQRRPWKEPIKVLFPLAVRYWLKRGIYKANTRSRLRQEPMPSEARAAIWPLLEPDVARLEALLHRPLRELWRQEALTGSSPHPGAAPSSRRSA